MMARPRRRAIVSARRLVLLLPLVVAVLAAALPGGAAQNNLATDTAALLALRDALDPTGRLIPWDARSATPCGGQWRGVACDAAGTRVVELRLPAKALRGTIPLGTVGNLTALRTLSLRSNTIHGEIPADVGSCVELRGLFLQGNSLTGAVPEGLFSLVRLRKVDLAGNRLTGGVSVGFNRLARLDTLFLELNQLGGSLPDGLNLSRLTRFNVSFNAQLVGPVPASLAWMPADAFVDTELCGGPLRACVPAPSSDGKSGKKLSRWAVVGIVIGAVAVILLVIGLVALLRRRRRAGTAAASSRAAADVHTGTAPITVTVRPAPDTTTNAAVAKQSSHPAGPPLVPAMISDDGRKLVFLGSPAAQGSEEERPTYDLETLLRASAEVLSKGVHGTTYRATLDGGAPVLCIKRLRETHIPEAEFRDAAVALGKLRHDNLTRLRAYFYSKEERLLVYDFVGAGSLSSLLHDNGTEGRARLDFTSRARIALAAARGVAYIHRAGSSHGNIMSTNIVVTATRDGAYVAGYGVPRLVGAAAPPQQRRGAGYRAPEVTDARAVGPSADAYSFGVVVLELLSGRAPAHAVPDGADGVDLPRWVRSVVQEEWTSEVFDSAIANEPRVEEEMMRLLQLGIECTEHRPDRRPVMADVEARIERIVEDASRKADFSSTDGSRSVSA